MKIRCFTSGCNKDAVYMYRSSSISTDTCVCEEHATEMLEILRDLINEPTLYRLDQMYAENIALELDTAEFDRQMLRKALVDLIGAGSRSDLNAMEIVLRTMPGACDEDRANSLNAIHALLATLDDDGGRPLDSQ